MTLSPDGRMIVDKSVKEITDELSRLADEGVGHDLYFDPQVNQMVRGELPDGSDCIPCQG
jgi:hypothetical protein